MKKVKPIAKLQGPELVLTKLDSATSEKSYKLGKIGCLTC